MMGTILLPLVTSPLTYVRMVAPHPPLVRALNTARSKLQSAGIKVVDWEPYKHEHGWHIAVSYLLRGEIFVI